MTAAFQTNFIQVSGFQSTTPIFVDNSAIGVHSDVLELHLNQFLFPEDSQHLLTSGSIPIMPQHFILITEDGNIEVYSDVFELSQKFTLDIKDNEISTSSEFVSLIQNFLLSTKDSEIIISSEIPNIMPHGYLLSMHGILYIPSKLKLESPIGVNLKFKTFLNKTIEEKVSVYKE